MYYIPYSILLFVTIQTLLACSSDSALDSSESANSPITLHDKEDFGYYQEGSDVFYYSHRYLDCKEGVLLDQMGDTNKTTYAFRGDTLIATQMDYGCDYTLTGGSAGTLTGTWTVASTQSDDSSCEPTAGQTLTFTFQNGTLTRDKATADFCFSTALLSGYSRKYPSLHFSSAGCGTLIATSPNGDQASITASITDGDLLNANFQLSYQGVSCERNMHPVQMTESTCSAAWDKFQSQNEPNFSFEVWAVDSTLETFNSCSAQWKATGELQAFLHVSIF